LDREDNKFKSRKFIVTVLTLAGTVFLAFFGNIDSNVALVFSVCVGAYNYANTKIARDQGQGQG
jgi:hypothetical protein